MNSPRVLVVDDSADDTYITTRLLEKLGCSVQACNDPSQVVAAAWRFLPHLILLDIAMPGLSGIEVALLLRRAYLPPFVLAAKTGFADEKHKAECLDAGFNHVLVKPVPLEQFQKIIELASRLAPGH